MSVMLVDLCADWLVLSPIITFANYRHKLYPSTTTIFIFPNYYYYFYYYYYYYYYYGLLNEMNMIAFYYQ